MFPKAKKSLVRSGLVHGVSSAMLTYTYTDRQTFCASNIRKYHLSLLCTFSLKEKGTQLSTGGKEIGQMKH